MENLDPRQMDFLKYYLDPKEETFSNAYQSAVKAGFTEEYAKVILNQNTEWLSESLSRRKRILNKAEKRGEELLDSETENIKADMVKHFTKTLGKEYYSERKEITGKDGENLMQNSQDLDLLAEEVSKRLKEKKLNDTQSRTA